MSEPVRIETCATHGLRFNAAATSGCARCLREAEPAPTPAPAAAGLGQSPLQLAIAGILVGVVGFSFFTVHNQAVAALQLPWLGASGEFAGSDPVSDFVHEPSLETLLALEDHPLLVVGRELDDDLDRQVRELEDPERRRRLTDDEVQQRVEQIYERLLGGQL